VSHKFYQFIPDPFLAYLADLPGKLMNGIPCGILKFKVETGGKPHGTNEAKLVLKESLLGDSDRSNQSRLDV
jgi:hypothetical protein